MLLSHVHSPGRRPLIAAAAFGTLLLAACGPDAPRATASPTAAAAAVAAAPTTDPPTTDPPTTDPPTTAPAATVPSLVGQSAAQARAALAQQGLRVAILYRSTTSYPAGTVISQSASPGTGVRPETTIVLTVAVAPPPPPPPPPSRSNPPPAPPSTHPAPPPSNNCDPSYPTVCLRDGIGDYDCQGGSGNGPNYVPGPFKVLPPDPFGLDKDHDGIGCE